MEVPNSLIETLGERQSFFASAFVALSSIRRLSKRGLQIRVARRQKVSCKIQSDCARTEASILLSLTVMITWFKVMYAEAD